MKIFIAEKSRPVRERLVQMVAELNNMNVIGHTDNASDAGERIAALKPQVALLGIHLGGGNAFEVLSKIRRQSANTRVILVSANPSSQHRQRAVELGADYYFDKAKELPRIAAALRQVSGEQP